jgi:hypothetical protein
MITTANNITNISFYCQLHLFLNTMLSYNLGKKIHSHVVTTVIFHENATVLRLNLT